MYGSVFEDGYIVTEFTNAKRFPDCGRYRIPVVNKKAYRYLYRTLYSFILTRLVRKCPFFNRLTCRRCVEMESNFLGILIFFGFGEI